MRPARAQGGLHAGVRLLPRVQRRAIAAIHTFAGHINEIGEGSLAVSEKLQLLDQQATAVSKLGCDGADPRLHALSQAHERFALPLDALQQMIAGVRADVLGGSYESFEELLLYCRLVAGSTGRLCLAVCGSADPERAAEHAEQLGVALQLTKLLLDLRAHAEHGRVYLPVEDFRRYGLLGESRPVMTAAALAVLAREASVGEPAALAGMDGGDPAQLYALVRFQVLRAQDWAHRGLELLDLLDRRSAAYVLVMSGTNVRLLRRVAQRPDRALAERVRLPARELAWVGARGVLGRAPRAPHPAERLS
jgi:phytoene synthase